MKQYNKPRKSCALFGLGFLETILSPQIGFLRGVFLANHLASNDNLTRTTKRQNTATKTNDTQKGAIINNNTSITHAKI